MVSDLLKQRIREDRLEAELEDFFYRRVKLLGGLPVKMAPTLAGIPDRAVFFPGGRVYFVELKRETGAASKIQKHRHAVLRKLGTHVYILSGRGQVLSWLRQVVDGHPALDIDA